MSSASSEPAVRARHREGRFGGTFWQAWLPEDAVTAVVVVAHGVSEHGGRYRYVVERLLPDGVTVYAIDHRGHGRSGGPRAQIERMRLVLDDLDTLIGLARTEHPGVPLFLLGHSMGGCIAIAFALEGQEKLDGLALSSPLAALEAAPLPLRVLARGLSVLLPGTGVIGVDAGAVSRDPEEVRAYEEDPLVYRGKLPARTVQELADTISGFEAGAPSLTVPLLVLLGTEDTLVPPDGGRMIHSRAGSADKTLMEYEGFYHELFNEPAGERDRVLGDLAAWIAERSTS